MDTGRFDLPRHLSILPLFHGLRATDLQRLARGCHLRPLSRDDRVFHVGQPCEEFQIAVTAQVQLFALSASGQEKVIERVRPVAASPRN